VAEDLVLVHELVDDLLGAADEYRARRTGTLLVNVTRKLAGEVCAPLRSAFEPIGKPLVAATIWAITPRTSKQLNQTFY
jgi:hypothetical protein